MRDNLRSNCCNSEVMAVGDETSYWVCQKCDKACDVVGNECKTCHRTSDIVDMSKCPFCEHDLELIREGKVMSDFDTRRGE